MIKRPIKKRVVKQTTLLIDGENLLKIGFNAFKDIQGKNGRVKTIYHFLNTIKRFYSEFRITKVVVFWEGENSRDIRRSYYEHYKTNRGGYTEDETFDLTRQRARIQQYLEELFVRQIIVDNAEGDDGIALYTRLATDEYKIIFSADKDFLQLINEHTHQYLPNRRVLVTPENFKKIYKYHHKNVALIKILAGDPADNICGIQGVGDKTIFKNFPEVTERPVTIDEIKKKCREILEKKPKNKMALNILGGVTKFGEWGDKFYINMDKVINLTNPLMSEASMKLVNTLITLPLNPEDRVGVQGITQMLMEDEIYQYFPYTNDNYYDYWSDFMTTINKEKRLFIEHEQQR